MIKGQSYGLCNNCWHYKYRDNLRNCRKYDFVFPKTSFEIFCRDYRRNFLKRLFTDHRTQAFTLIAGVPILLLYIFSGGWFYDCMSARWRKQLKPSTLYFYMDQSESPLQTLATFSELHSQTVLKSVTIKNDSEAVQEILFDSAADIADIGNVFEVDVNGHKSKLSVRTERRLTSLISSQWAIFFAKPETKTYKLLPHYFM